LALVPPPTTKSFLGHACGENLVKIGPIDPEIICLKRLFKNKLVQAEHKAGMAGMQTGLKDNCLPTVLMVTDQTH